jgi:IS30 family transposase|tara:strand:- start:231 stop:1223 length:993 start_codon:yes stop_codon:yes gene_type:complete
MANYTHFRKEERMAIFELKQQGLSNVAIARELGRHKSNIGKELQRNSSDVGYLPDTAHAKALERKAKHAPKLDRCPELLDHVSEKLRIGWSPEAIAGRAKKEKREGAWSLPLLVSHESIYQFIYSVEGLKLGLYKLLAKGKSKRGFLCGRKSRNKPAIPNRVSIHERPKIIDRKSEFGHFEGDLTFCKGERSMNIGVLVEKSTRFALCIKNDSKKAVVVMKGIFNTLAQLPAAARKTLTLDNGTEFVYHTILSKFMDMKTYFCDPHSPWQKGQVERTNALLHRFIDKKTNLKKLSNKAMQHAVAKLNDTPRKCLGFQTPAELFHCKIKSC